MMRASSNMAPKIEPMTMPAIAPPDKPCPLLLLCEAVELPVADGKRLPMLVVNGSLTFWQRVSVLEKRQHESVAFGELAAQYEHRAGRLLLKPQLFTSFWNPCIQLDVNESAGKAQLVKSARISVSALGALDPQRSGVEAIDSSLVAKAAWSMSVPGGEMIVYDLRMSLHTSVSNWQKWVRTVKLSSVQADYTGMSTCNERRDLLYLSGSHCYIPSDTDIWDSVSCRSICYGRYHAYVCCEYAVAMYWLNWESKVLTSDTNARKGLSMVLVVALGCNFIPDLQQIPESWACRHWWSIEGWASGWAP